MNIPLGKIVGTHLRHGGETFARRGRGSDVRGNPNHDALPKLRRHSLIKETQRIMLNFPIKEASLMQDTTERAVESQRNGESAISLLAVTNMCREPGPNGAKARALFAPLFGFGSHYSDPDFMEGLDRVMQGYLRQQFEAEVDIEDSAEETHDMFGGAQ